jgi:hypothetical protein
MTTKTERNEQMNTLIRQSARRRGLRMEFENGRGRIVTTEPQAANDGPKQDDDNSKGARDDDN